ncbi:MAG TPA: PAS domain-containing protein, partial [Longimicrobiaceae bacterium]
MRADAQPLAEADPHLAMGVVHLFADDITARRALSDGVLESAAVGIAACDRELRWVAWNAAMEALTGLSADEVLGEPACEVAAALAGEAPEALLRAVLEGAAAQVDDVEDGVRRPLSVRWSPHRIPDGEVAGAVVVAHDVTELRRAEDQTLRLAAIPREAPNPVLECDAEGNV